MKRLIYVVIFILFILFIFYLASELFINNRIRFGSSMDFKTYLKQSTNFVPLRTINNYLVAYSHNNINLHTVTINLLGNLVAFAPFGFFLPVLFKKFRSFGIYFLFMLSIIVSVEVLQVLLRVGSCDVDDVLLNIVGAIIMYLFMQFHFTKRWLSKVDLSC